MGKFSDKVFGANVDQKTKDIFNALQRGQYEFSPGESVTDLPEHTRYLGEKTTFARMWVALHATGSDAVDEIFYHSINDNKSNSYEANQSIDGESYFIEGTENPFLKPNAGITSISSKTEGPLGAIRRTTVEFTVHNKQDFDSIYLPFFLRPGATVVIDYGWSDKNMELYDIGTQLANADIELSQFKKFIYGGQVSGPNGEQIFIEDDKPYYISKEDGERVENPNVVTDPGWIDNHDGLAQTDIALVQSYNSKVNENGSFSCTIETISENASILDNEISSDNNLKHIFSNKFEQILITALTKDPTLVQSKIAGINKYNVFSREEREQTLNTFFEKIPEEGGFNYVGFISPTSIRNGVYLESATPDSITSLYISFGLFTDLFLNTYVAKNPEKQRYNINFKLEGQYIRFESNLYRRQITSLGALDKLPLFLYPEDWTESKDGIRDENTDCGSVEGQKIGDNPYKTPIIPLRELFISVPLIKDAFSKKQTINDAINYILSAINEDSYGIFDLKMKSPNRSYSGITIQDKNLVAPLSEVEKFLTFDVTSGNGIATNLDYSFDTPKGGLQNLIAIGNKIDRSIFDVTSLDNLNFLNVLKDEKREGKPNAFIRSLPQPKREEPSEDIDEDDVDFRYAKDFFKDTPVISDVAESAFEDVILEASTIKKEKEKNSVNSTNKVKPNENTDNGEKIKKLEASGDRDFWGKEAKRQNILTKKEESISPVLPINLTLSVYGNTFLTVGDVFTINFLPKSFIPHVYFQISGVEHKLGSNWETTYQTFFRVRPTSKQDNKEVVTVYSEAAQEKILDNILNDGLKDSVTTIKPLVVHPSVETEVKEIGQDLTKYKSAQDAIEKTGEIPNILDTFFDAKKVTTPQHVRMAYAWSETIFEYIEKAQENGKKVIYYIRYSGGSNSKGHYDDNANLAVELDSGDDFDIFVDVDTNTSAGSPLQQYYLKPMKSEKFGKGINDEKEQVEALMKEKLNKKINGKSVYKDLINLFNTKDGTNKTYPLVKRSTTHRIKDNYAPIITRVRFKTKNIKGDADKVTTFYSGVPKKKLPFINDFIPVINIPIWLVDNIEDFLQTFYKNFEDTKLEKIVGFWGN